MAMCECLCVNVFVLDCVNVCAYDVFVCAFVCMCVSCVFVCACGCECVLTCCRQGV